MEVFAPEKLYLDQGENVRAMASYDVSWVKMPNFSHLYLYDTPFVMIGMDKSVSFTILAAILAFGVSIAAMAAPTLAAVTTKNVTSVPTKFSYPAIALADIHLTAASKSWSAGDLKNAVKELMGADIELIKIINASSAVSK